MYRDFCTAVDRLHMNEIIVEYFLIEAKFGVISSR